MAKLDRKQRIKFRVRKKIKGSADRPRLSVFRSNTQIYCQLIDDISGKTLAAASSADEGFAPGGNKSDRAKRVGSVIAQKAKDLNISTIVFDRGSYLYHGRVKALAEGARESGLVF